FPVWATVLLVLLVLALVAAAGVSVEVESGKESVKMPCRFTACLPADVRIEWTDLCNRKVHVHQNGSDCSAEQNQRYRTRTKMDKDLSLTLRRPTCEDSGIYSCRVYRDGDTTVSLFSGDMGHISDGTSPTCWTFIQSEDMSFVNH
uniref:Ig-like domain-containing protein n=1 Tax=Poecilia reticulata TaxID=8081 RepID=A0A3P9NY55_POERE